MTYSDFLSTITTVAAVGTLLYVVWDHWPRQAGSIDETASEFLRRKWIPVVLAVIAWAAVAVNWFINKAEIIYADAVINSWYERNGAFVVEVRGAPLLEFKNEYNLVLYVKPPVPGVDRMADTHGEKSQSYTIYNGIISLIVPITKNLCSSFSPTRGGAVELIVVLFPKKFSPEQITSLSSVETMGGKIVAHPGWPTGYPPECNNLK